MRKNRIAIVGHFGSDKDILDGQTIKTRTIYNELKNTGIFHIQTVDTYYKNHNVLKLLWDFLRAILTCKHVIVLVAENGMRTLFPILHFCSRFLKKKIYHSVIGASLADRVIAHRNYKKYLNSFVVNWCETVLLVEKLQALGVANAELLYNCKRLTPLSKNEIAPQIEMPYKLCIFSRVMREKGIEDAICAVAAINKRYQQTIYTLDIYGPVDPEQQCWFHALEKTFPEYIRYGGSIPFDSSVGVLKNYFAMLFPTRYWTEGVPGTIIDAYAAGLPVIASRWENFSNIIDSETGIGYEFSCVDDLVRVLDKIRFKPSLIWDRKMNCVERYRKYSPDTIVKQMLDKIVLAS